MCFRASVGSMAGCFAAAVDEGPAESSSNALAVFQLHALRPLDRQSSGGSLCRDTPRIRCPRKFHWRCSAHRVWGAVPSLRNSGPLPAQACRPLRRSILSTDPAGQPFLIVGHVVQGFLFLAHCALTLLSALLQALAHFISTL